MAEELRKQGGLVDAAAVDAADKMVDQAAVAPELDEAAKAAAAREARRQALYEENERAEDERARAEAERMRDVDDEDEDDTLDLSDLGDDFFEIECPSCGEDIVIDESVLDIGEVTCPNCGDRFSMDLVEEPETDDGADDPQ